MTTTTDHSSSGEFELGHYRFYRDDRDHLILIPSGPDLEGYLALDQKENNFVQVRLLKTQDTNKRETYKAVWKQIRDKNDCNICPEILAFGEEESVPYYVSSLPAGEPVSYFVKRGGPIPPEVAVKMVLKFVRSVRAQNPVHYEHFEMSPETLWVSRCAHEPRIILGDFSPVPRDGAEGINAYLCLDLLKYLSGNPPFNENFQDLMSSIEKGPRTLGFMANKLEDYANGNPPVDFWTEQNMPRPMLNQLVDPQVALQAAVPDPAIEGSQEKSATGPVWPHILTIGSTAVVFGILGVAGWIFMRDNKDRELVADTRPEITEPVVAPIEKTTLSVNSFPVPEVFEPVAPAPEPPAPEPVVAEPEELAVTQPESNSEELPIGEPYQPPLPPVNGPEEVVDIFEVEEAAENVAAAPLEPAKEEDITEILPDEPEVVEFAKVPTGEISTDPEVEGADANVEMIDQLSAQATKARADNQLIKAIEKQIEILAIAEDSVDTKLSLNEDLYLLQQEDKQDYAPEEIATLKKASTYNTKAGDILVKHYRKTGNWNFEIATLVKQGRNDRPEKLSEAGKRIFENPSSTEADHKKAREYFIEAAKLGDKSGQFFAGECMILGRGGSKDLPQGTFYLRQAIDKGDPRAMDLLGVCYVRGWGVRRDDEKAVELFQSAVDNGNVPAYYNLGARYAQGQGVERDPVKAAELFSEGSEKGNAHCMLVFARCLDAGYGRDRDMEKAKYWFSRSAEKGNIEAIEWCKENDLDYLKFLANSL